VLGRVLTPAGLQVMDAIAALPIYHDTTTHRGSPFSDLPELHDTAGAAPATTNLAMSPITVLNDTTAPTITITQPTNGELLTQADADSAVQLADESGGTSVASYTSSTLDLSPDQHAFAVSATDYAGNQAQQDGLLHGQPGPAGAGADRQAARAQAACVGGAQLAASRSRRCGRRHETNGQTAGYRREGLVAVRGPLWLP